MCVDTTPYTASSRYTITFTTDLAENSFVHVRNGIPATPPLNSYRETLHGLKRAYYRVAPEE